MTTTAISTSTDAVRDLAMRVGSYIPRSAGMGLSYHGGSFTVNPENLASPDFPGVRSPLSQDSYVSVIPDFYGELEFTRGERNGAALAADAAADARDPEVNGGEEGSNSAAEEYTPEELRVIDDLQARDRAVRAHEQAHVSVGGPYIRGGAAFEYQQGPDDRRYAVGGEVSIDTSPVRDNPEATIAKMQVVRAAAMAPVDPSPQDRAVASAASREEARAAAELGDLRAAEARGDGENPARRSRAYADAVSAYAEPHPARMASIINLAV